MCYQLRRTCALVTTMSLLAVTALGCAESGGSSDSSRTMGIDQTPRDSRYDGMADHTQSMRTNSPTAEVVKQIKIDNFTFDPPVLTVSVGTKVTWFNHDDVPHTATSTRKPKVFDSGTLDTDDKFSFVFTWAGTYEYFCAVHPKMKAQIIVK
jgi:plastocyanin